MRLALHACCGPCLIEPLDDLVSRHEVVIVFANPNIHPAAEYLRRWDALRAWAAANQVPAVEVECEPEAWADAVAGCEESSGERCARCYAHRLDLAAVRAVELGCDALSTTLSVSPYQDQAAIDHAGCTAAEKHGLTWLFEDHRHRYADAVRRSREAGMYRQSYCGCARSQREAASQRVRYTRRERD